MWLDGRFQSQLQRAGMTRFDAVMEHRGGLCLRVLEDRENWYFAPDRDGAAVGVYLKKHRLRTFSSLLRATLRAGCGVSPARAEAEYASSLPSLGIDVMRLVAYGERLRADGIVESFLLTEELAGYVELQEFLRNRFPVRSACSGPRPRPAADHRPSGRDCAAIPRRRLQPPRLLYLPFPRQGAPAGAIRHPPDRLAAGAAEAMVSPPLDRQGPGPVGLFRAPRPHRSERVDRLDAALPGHAEAPPGRQAADPRRGGAGEANAAAAGGAIMRVGLVVERFDPLRGGLEQWTCAFAEELAARGHEIHVVSREFTAKAQRLPIVAHQVPRVHSPLEFAAAAEATLTALPLDVIHDMGVGWHSDIFQPHGGSWASVAARKVLLLPRWLRPLKLALQRVTPRGRVFRQLMARQYADRGQILVALSQKAADDFVQFHQVAPERIRIVYNGVDAERFSPAACRPWRESMRRRLGIDPQTVLLLLVANNFQLKGVATLLRAAARLRGAGTPVQTLIVGGKRLGGWRRTAARLGLAGAVRFLGPVDDVLPHYAAADVYVHPTIYDTCSLVTLEAAACGLPVVTTRCNGAAEMFHDGADIHLIAEPGDDAALAAKVAGLLDPAARSVIGAAARQTAMRHTFAANVDEILALYQEVVHRRVRRAGDAVVWSGACACRTGAKKKLGTCGLLASQRSVALASRQCFPGHRGAAEHHTGVTPVPPSRYRRRGIWRPAPRTGSPHPIPLPKGEGDLGSAICRSLAEER